MTATCFCVDELMRSRAVGSGMWSRFYGPCRGKSDLGRSDGNGGDVAFPAGRCLSVVSSMRVVQRAPAPLLASFFSFGLFDLFPRTSTPYFCNILPFRHMMSKPKTIGLPAHKKPYQDNKIILLGSLIGAFLLLLNFSGHISVLSIFLKVLPVIGLSQSVQKPDLSPPR